MIGYLGLIALAGACAIGWLVRWVACAALVKYMADQGYRQPTDEEMQECCMYAWKKLLHVR